MKKLISLSFILFLFLNAFSTKVDVKKAQTVAQNFLSEKNKQSVKLSLVFQKKYDKSNESLYYIFNLSNTKGFIIVSGDNNVYPVLAYSFENSYDVNKQKPDAYIDWFNTIEKEILFMKEKKLSADKKTSEAWVYYSNPNFKASKSTKDVSPLLTTTWNQGSGYNSLCPETSTGGSGGYVWAGCVATAMAQSMNYHEWPVSGEGSHSYIPSSHPEYGEQSADFENTVYDWANMPDGSGNAEISKLIYHCGVSVNMNYSPSGSGAYSSSAASALKTYFKYSPNLILTSKYSYTEENWARMLRTEIDSGRPMYYSGYGTGGHAFNVDGYQGADYFHFNWGWGGYSNGYFYLNDLTPSSYDFTNGQAAIVGMQPRNTYPGIDCSNPIILTKNIPYAGTTVNSANIANTYGGLNYQETGKEVVHQITTTYTGRIRASITDLNGNNLDVFILSDCSQDSLIAYGDSIAVADNTEPGTYLIVVDGKYGSEGSYTLTVAIPDEKPDLIITDQKIGPNILQATDLANISFTIKNIGNNTASASKTKIYYSDNNVFDGSDTYIDVINIPSLSPGTQYDANQNIMIPAAASAGTRYIIFIADADNEVIETDELLNTETAQFNVPVAGIMDCSGSVALSDDVWYFGNTATDGQNNIDMYSWGMYPDKEIIHSISSTHSGLANVKFTEKIPGNLVVLILSTCNENACINMVGVWNPADTIGQVSFNMYSGVSYYLVVDGEEGVSGNYGIKVNTPGACPEPEINYWGNTDLCTGQGVSLYTDWAYSKIQWYKDNVISDGMTNSNIWATEAGSYKVKVTENGCSAFSPAVEVRINDAPSNADITAVGDTTFCEGNDVSLNLNTGTGYTVQWLKNGNPVEGETGLSYLADETGIYSAKVTNISCSITSNTKQVTVNPITADIGELARVNANDLVSWFSCDINDNTDLSGNENNYFGSWTFPEDRNGIWNKASYYNGQWDAGTTTNSFNNPNTFTISLWVKTNTISGGMIFGLGDSLWGASTVCDRMIYMDDAGRVYFGLLDGTAKTISTTESYNDDNWHLFTASLSSSGAELYVDGVLKAEDTNIINGGNYTGWWKIGYDEIDAAFSNVPSSMYFRGTVDEIRVYNRKLLPEETAYLYNENEIFNATVEQSNLCESGSTNVILENTENFIEYQLRNDADNSAAGSSVTGNAGDIILPTGTLTQTTTFNILATNPQTGCSRELNSLFTVNVNDFPAASISGDNTICEYKTTDLTINLTGTAPWSITYTDGTNSFNKITSDNPYIFSVSDAGTYQITALSDANCTGTSFSGSAIVNVNPIPNVNLGHDTTITVNDTLVLYAGEGLVSYLWNDNSTEDTLAVIGADSGIGNYEFYVTVEDGNTCENSDTINVSVEQGSSINLFDKSNLKIYPNPSSGIYFIEGVDIQNVTHIRILDINGRIIQEIKPDAELVKINIQNEPAGIYFIRIINKKEDKFIKILKQD
ncbi:MAG: T9SS type A sorting domain-containing protein [Chlorobi bacterium]|nr:T9SS type A sorting domain-containing protein [Chlorobiota bacterium]